MTEILLVPACAKSPTRISQIGDVSVNRTEHLGSVEVNFRLSELLLSSIERSFRLNGVSGIDLLLLGRCGQVGQMLTPIGLDLLHLEIGGSLLHRGAAGELSNFKIKRFDCVEYIALVNKPVVNNPYIVDLTRYLGCDVRDLHTYGAIPRPGSR